MRRSVQALQEAYQGRIDFHILNVDDFSTRDLAVRYNLTAIPLIVLLDAQGNMVARLEGYQTPEQLQAAMATLLGN